MSTFPGLELRFDEGARPPIMVSGGGYVGYGSSVDDATRDWREAVSAGDAAKRLAGGGGA